MRKAKKIIFSLMFLMVLFMSAEKILKLNIKHWVDSSKVSQLLNGMSTIIRSSEPIEVKESNDKTKEVIGAKLDEYKGVAVFNNGEAYTESYGRNFSSDGYYYGYKWQCVEYVKRFYYDVKKHKMPDVYGHAKDFFDPKVSHGSINKARGLFQFTNGENIKPEVDDIIVFNDTKYGHIAIVTEVGEDYVEVIQQNVHEKTRDKFKMTVKSGKYLVGNTRMPAGWLRMR